MQEASSLKRIRRAYKTLAALGLKKCLRYSSFLLKETLVSRFSGPKSKDPARKEAEVILVSLPLSSASQPPIGIASVKSYLESKGMSCRCMDLNNKLYTRLKDHPIYPFDKLDEVFLDKDAFERFSEVLFEKIIDEWTADILAHEPKYVGMSVNSSLVYFPLERLSRKIRAARPDVGIILGGPCVKYDGENILRKGLGDIAVKGDGEKVFLELIHLLREGRTLSDLKGILFLEDDAAADTGEPEPLRDLDEMPFPDFDDFPLREYQPDVMGVARKLPIMGSRGCPANCDFCNVEFLFGRYRARSARSIFDEMRDRRQRYGVRDFVFNDSLVNANPRVLEELCDLIIASGEVFRWNGMYRVWPVPAPEGLFMKMAKAGCTSLSIGVESGSEKVRKDMAKHFTNDMLVKELRAMHEAGIYTNLMFIIGYPTETEEDFQETVRLFTENRRIIGQVNLGMTCYIGPGTDLWRKRERYGVEYDEDGHWYVGENTLEERMRRLEAATRAAREAGLVGQLPILNREKPKAVLY